MLALKRTQNVFTKYSKNLYGVILDKKNLVKSSCSPHEYVSDILDSSLVPFPTDFILEYQDYQHQYSENLFREPITHIPLLEDPNEEIRMKLIHWNPGACSHWHNHNGEDCWYRALYPGMGQIVHDENVCTFTANVPDNEFGFINDTIGTHKMYNESNSYVNLTFHLYMKSNEDSKYTHFMSDPDLIWYGTRS